MTTRHGEFAGPVAAGCAADAETTSASDRRGQP